MLARLLRDGATIFEGARLLYADGRAAGAVACETGGSVVTVDYIRDSDATPLIAFAASDARARRAAVNFAARAGKDAVEIADRPGGVVLRTLLQLANAAADALRDKAASGEAIDTAMRAGVNYPFGPWEWVTGFGPARAVAALAAIADETGDAIYRPSEVLRAAARTS